jgi:hypothetical protein
VFDVRGSEASAERVSYGKLVNGAKLRVEGRTKQTVSQPSAGVKP